MSFLIKISSFSQNFPRRSRKLRMSWWVESPLSPLDPSLPLSASLFFVICYFQIYGRWRVETVTYMARKFYGCWKLASNRGAFRIASASASGLRTTKVKHNTKIGQEPLETAGKHWWVFSVGPEPLIILCINSLLIYWLLIYISITLFKKVIVALCVKIFSQRDHGIVQVSMQDVSVHIFFYTAWK